MCIALQSKSRIYEFSQRMVTSVAIERILEMLRAGNRWRFWIRDGGVLKCRLTNINNVSIKVAHRLSQDNGYNVMVAVVGCVGLDFSIFFDFLGLAKMGLVQDSCKYNTYVFRGGYFTTLKPLKLLMVIMEKKAPPSMWVGRVTSWLNLWCVVFCFCSENVG